MKPETLFIPVFCLCIAILTWTLKVVQDDVKILKLENRALVEAVQNNHIENVALSAVGLK